MRLFILGCAGSGKGTISKLLLERLNDSAIRYYNVGGILREQSSQDPHIKEIHASGGLVDSSRVLGIFEDALNQNQFIIDGSPRRPEEADFILSHNKWISNPGYLIHLNIDPALAKARLLARGRFDDNEDIIEKRFLDHNKYTMRSVHAFAAAQRVFDVDATQDPKAIVDDILRFLERVK